MALAWAGKIGAGCSPAGCSDCPTKSEPASIECPCCHEMGCGECNGVGRFELACCPRKFIDGWYWELFRFATLFRKGVPPVHGGALDQESWFMEASEFLWSEQDRVAPNPMLF